MEKTYAVIESAQFVYFCSTREKDEEVYNRLIKLGIDHEEAANVSAWAQEAPIDAVYVCETGDGYTEVRIEG